MVVTFRSKRVDLYSSTGRLKIGVERGWLKKSGIDASQKYLTINEVTEGISYSMNTNLSRANACAPGQRLECITAKEYCGIKVEDFCAVQGGMPSTSVNKRN